MPFNSVTGPCDYSGEFISLSRPLHLAADLT